MARPRDEAGGASPSRRAPRRGRTAAWSMMRAMRLCLIAVLGLAVAARASAAQAFAVSVEELARTSDAVVRGKVESDRKSVV